jgi:hypothetical protein
MRRKEKEVCNPEVIEKILLSAQVMHLGFCDGDEPYVVPVLFGYEDRRIYVHSAPEGRKVHLIHEGGKVCFEADTFGGIERKGLPCKWTLDYASVMGVGEASVSSDPEEMRKGLDVIVRHYGGRQPYEYSEASLSKMVMIRIDVKSMTCKRSM